MKIKDLFEGDVAQFTPRQFSKNALIQYLQTILWSSTDDEGVELDSNYEIEDFSPQALSKARLDLNNFWKTSKDLIVGEDEGKVAHDFWLTRNGHGAGFWDGGYKKSKGEKLTKIAKQFGEITPYIGNDGKIYLG